VAQPLEGKRNLSKTGRFRPFIVAILQHVAEKGPSAAWNRSNAVEHAFATSMVRMWQDGPVAFAVDAEPSGTVTIAGLG
jgi:hypothetical protein